MFSCKAQIISPEYIAQLEKELGLLLYNNDLVIDSRKVRSNTIFCAYPGGATDGRNYIQTAIDQGAQAIIWEPGLDLAISIKNYPVANLMHYVGILAAIKFKYPSKAFYTIGVTGTNGKTSITHWLAQAYTLLDKKTGLIGTTGVGIYPQIGNNSLTTPDPITLQSLLAGFRKEAVEIAAMEVSSHGLCQGRVNGVDFQTAVFTNLTQDHLDYHKTMENYYQAKNQLFYWQGLKNAVINSDDKYGLRLITELKERNSSLNILSYGINSGDLRAEGISLTNQGINFTLCYQDKKEQLHANIVGRFNIYNLLAVIGTLLLNDVSWNKLPAIISNLKPVVGRMDATILPGKPLIVVDYSHTPDALEKGLETLAEIKNNGCLICVFGCGGNRDSSKRPQMGKIATEIADKVIITTDNPRFEAPEQIIADIIAGIDRTNYTVIAKRKEAIKKAIQTAKPEDIILIAGKGHEDYQEVKGIKYHFSDLEIVKELLNAYS